MKNFASFGLHAPEGPGTMPSTASRIAGAVDFADARPCVFPPVPRADTALRRRAFAGNRATRPIESRPGDAPPTRIDGPPPVRQTHPD